MKHNRAWFKNKISKRIYCDDHDENECDGILLESDIVINNCIAWQNDKRHIRYSDTKSC